MCLPARMRWPSSKLTTSHTRASGKTNAAAVAALAASTSARAGMAVKVARTIPVVYSAATDRTPRAPRMTTATHIPVREVLVGSNAWRCGALMVAHELAWTAVATAEKPMAGHHGHGHRAP